MKVFRRLLVAGLRALFRLPRAPSPPAAAVVPAPDDPYRWTALEPEPSGHAALPLPRIELSISRAPDEWSGLFWHVEQPLMVKLTCGTAEFVGRVDALPPIDVWAHAILDAWSDEAEALGRVSVWLDEAEIEVEHLDTGEILLLDLALAENACDDLRSYPGHVVFQAHRPGYIPPMPIVFQYRT